MLYFLVVCSGEWDAVPKVEEDLDEFSRGSRLFLERQISLQNTRRGSRSVLER